MAARAGRRRRRADVAAGDGARRRSIATRRRCRPTGRRRRARTTERRSRPSCASTASYRAADDAHAARWPTSARASADVRGLEPAARAHPAARRGARQQRPEAVEVADRRGRGQARRRAPAAAGARSLGAARARPCATYRLADPSADGSVRQLKPSLEDIKALSPDRRRRRSPWLQRIGARGSLHADRAIVPPEELTAAHALLVSAAQLAATPRRSGARRRSAGDMARAWDASSAAAGALMLGARARTDIQTLLQAAAAPGDHTSPDAARPRPRPARLPATSMRLPCASPFAIAPRTRAPIATASSCRRAAPRAC